MPRVAVLDYGMGNLRSVATAVERAGGTHVVTSDPDEIATADGLVVPGVGAFDVCVANLRQRELDRAIQTFVATGRPVLGVCLGMQILFDHSEEGDSQGLGLLPGEVRRITGGVKVPHVGWNEAIWKREHPLLAGIPSGTRFYFVHSYVCRPTEDVTVAQTDHGVGFASAVTKDNLFAVQFHPERSGEAGLELYRNLVKEAG